MNTNFSPIYQRVNALTQNANTQNSPQFEAARAKQQGMISAARASLNKPTLDYEKIFNQPVEQGSVAVQNPTNAITDWSQFEFESPQTKAQRIAKEQQDELTARNEAFQISQMEKQQAFAISEREKSEAFQKEMQAMNAAQSGGGGMSVICTRIHQLGYLDDDVFALDSRFGETLLNTQPEIIIGYHAWAKPFVSKLHGKTQFSRLLIRAIVPFTRAWTYEMATYYGLEKHPNCASEILGKMLMAIGMPLCRFIGQCKMQGAKNAAS